MQKVTRDVYKTAKDQLGRGYTVPRVAKLHGLSTKTVYRIRNATAYKGIDGYFYRFPAGRSADQIMKDYIELPVIPRWKIWKRGKNDKKI